MKFADCQKWCDKNIKRLQAKVGIPHWKITIELENIGNGAAGMCYALADYERATIDIDPHQVENEEMLEEILTHELLHICHAPFTVMREALLEALKNESEATRSLVSSLYSTAAERTVKNLERLLAANA